MAHRSTSRLLVHVVWATRGRERWLHAALDARISEILGKKARQVGCLLLGSGFASDHVHVLLRVAATVTVAELVRQMKGGSAHDLNEHAIMSGRLAWQGGYWAESFGPSDFDRLAAYMRSQREHHDDAHRAEQWQRD